MPLGPRIGPILLSNVILIEIAELEFVRSGKLENVRKVLLENVLEKL